MPPMSNKKYDGNQLMAAKQKTILDGNKIFDVSELFRCYFDLYSMCFRYFISMFSLSLFCLFYVFGFRCFVNPFFVILLITVLKGVSVC